ncbi:hypothetical protein [Natronolimnohabitans innermongolicus]|uniref:Uncharacterized protein n=1 Tax=Natronolimnohabitans innermongolicus JCM 12255 TaxID=1227499 RepID=L9WU35_9EURY|nr:hypothetical protein [Natronolimnohabitans innermongolicus]ELY52970.1 hypothetical protein C493_15273 [Natronolimnohabitans innermongolicus JCM 12255]
MGSTLDAALAVLVLVAVIAAFALVDAALSPLAVVAGALGTIAFELLAARAYETVRAYWERPLVQAGSVGLALLGIVVGARFAPSIVFSFALGALVTYLAYLGFWRIGIVGR